MQMLPGPTPEIVTEEREKRRDYRRLAGIGCLSLGVVLVIVVAGLYVLFQFPQAAAVAIEVTPDATRRALNFAPTWTPTATQTPFALDTPTNTPTRTATPTITQTPTALPATDTPVPPPIATTRPVQVFIPNTATPRPPTDTPTPSPVPLPYRVESGPALIPNRPCTSQFNVYGYVRDGQHRGIPSVLIRYINKYGNKKVEQPGVTRTGTEAGYYELTLGASANDWDIFIADAGDRPLSSSVHMHVEVAETGNCWWELNWIAN